MIALSMKQKKKTIITFYDVVKAYDRADMDDMLVTMNASGVKGKIWRLMRSINEGLKAKVNTKAGLSREIVRETGGKQGGKLIVSLFAKMMDTLATDLFGKGLGIKIGEELIPTLLFVDDSVTFADGYKQQEDTLKVVDEFAVKHKIEWGAAKSQTMEVGNHKEQRQTWNLGEKVIKKCDSYRYLGDVIMRNGKNQENLKERLEKVKNNVRAIITCCRSEVMKRIGTRIAFQLHESVTIASMLFNAETWTLNMTEKKAIDRAEVYAWKKMLGLPITTPTAGVVVTVGSLFASIRVAKKQLMFLQKVLKRDSQHWTRVIIFAISEQNIGWAKQVNELLASWSLVQEWQVIQGKTVREWKTEVEYAAELANKNKILQECETKYRGERKQKTKTKHVESIVNHAQYQRKPDDLLSRNKTLMGRYGMIDCASNYSTKYGRKFVVIVTL